MDNSNLGLWIGLTYFVIACLAWIPFDYWLHKRHHPYITTCVRRLMEGGSWYAVLAVGCLGFVFALFVYHFFYERAL
jgi:hypothetical protein